MIALFWHSILHMKPGKDTGGVGFLDFQKCSKSRRSHLGMNEEIAAPLES